MVVSLVFYFRAPLRYSYDPLVRVGGVRNYVFRYGLARKYLPNYFPECIPSLLEGCVKPGGSHGGGGYFGAVDGESGSIFCM